MPDILLFLQYFTWRDAVDIALNSFIVFRVYLLFRRTRVFRVILGLMLLWVFQRVASALGLLITSWALGGITAVAALIIIIVFRDEIFQVLQAKTLKALLWGIPQTSTQTPVEIISEGIYELARRWLGALIVFPARDSLEGIVQHGIEWNGRVSSEMILSIFWPDNPVHDGAVIIQDDRVTTVGAILPLSRRDDFPSHFGTRHRAAAGLSERSDALAIVVSEERGEVLAIKNGRFVQVKDRPDLERLLRKHLGLISSPEPEQTKEKFRIAVAAVLSISLVVATWLSFSRGLESLTTLKVPIQYTSRDPNLEFIGSSAKVAELDLSGPGRLIRSLSSDDIRVRLDLGEAVAGVNSFTLTKENIALPRGLVLTRIEPTTLEVDLDFPTHKELPIQVDWTGALPEYLVLTDVKLEPQKVTVVGGSRILKNITTIYTEKVPLDKLTSSGTVSVNLALNPASIEIDDGGEEEVAITYTIRTRQENGSKSQP
jgi:diadenylate cyclase